MFSVLAMNVAIQAESVCHTICSGYPRHVRAYATHHVRDIPVMNVAILEVIVLLVV